MEYVNLKFTSLPRICFAHRCTIRGNSQTRKTEYYELTFVEKGEVRVKMKQFGTDRIVRDGEFFFAPAGVLYGMEVRGDCTHSSIAFFLECDTRICEESEIVFDKPDNTVLVEIENLFVPMFGKVNEEADKLGRQIIAESKHVYKEYSNLRCAQSIIRLLLSLSYDSVTASDELLGNRYYADKINDFLYANYSDPELDMQAVAAHLGRHPNYLSAVYKSVTQKTVMEALKGIRMIEAKRLLLCKKYFVKDIAKMVGFSDCNYFSVVFKKETGVSPDNFGRRSSDNSGEGKKT